MTEPAKTLIILGFILVAIGLVMLGGRKWPMFGKLPGDIVVKRGTITFFFPIATSFVAGIISLALYLINKFR